MNRRELAVPTLLAAALALAACGGGASPAPATADAGVAAGPTTAPAATQAPGAASPDVATPAAGDPATPAPAAAGPIDACALLTPDEVAGLVAEPTAEAASDTAGPIPSYSCTWSAGSSGAMIPVSLAVKASPGFVTGSGTTAEFAKAMIQAEGSNAENNGRVVEGLGDAASVTSVVAFDATVQFLQGDTLVALTYTGENGATKQDAVVDLARAVAGRLP